MRLYDILDAAIIKRFITAIAIPENSDLNDYITPGRYYIDNSDIAFSYSPCCNVQADISGGCFPVENIKTNTLRRRHATTDHS